MYALLYITVTVVAAVLIAAIVLWDALWDNFKAWFLGRLEREDIMSRDRSEAYMVRRWIFGHRTSHWALMLHHMLLPDQDACHHDHPWTFITLVLRGGYWEEITRPVVNGVVQLKRGEVVIGPGRPRGAQATALVRRWNGPGTVLYRPATHVHRITELPAGECWTLVFRFDKSRSWGFWTNAGHIWWREFINMRGAFGVLWCGTDTEAYSLPGEHQRPDGSNCGYLAAPNGFCNKCGAFTEPYTP